MTGPARIILASGSAIRADILRGAGVPFEVIKPRVDEAIIKRAAKEDGAGLEETAMMLAEAKCLDVARREPGIVIGADQIMEFEGKVYDKPGSMAEAKARLLETQGATHTLINAVAVACDGNVVWRNLERPALFMRQLSEVEIDDYLGAAGPEILASVGAYQIEKLGVRLFDRIEGDHTAVLGLSLFPLLDFLRREGALVF